MLILDDATSSVDATTESRIKEALAEVMEGRTTFVIAHRMSTISLADEVIVLEDGRIAARGSHEELVEQSALYREIAQRGAARPPAAGGRRAGPRGGGPVSGTAIELGHGARRARARAAAGQGRWRCCAPTAAA